MFFSDIENEFRDSSDENKDNTEIYKDIKKEYLNIKEKKLSNSNTPNQQNTRRVFIYKSLGKKRIRDKCSYDNIFMKLKINIFKAILNYMNTLIQPVELKNEIINKKKPKINPFFLQINKKVIKQENLLNSQLKDIFSYDVSLRYQSYGLDYNRKLVNKIYEENTNKRLISALERTFFECLEQLRGSKKYEELEGLEKEYEIVIKKFEIKEENNDFNNNFNFLINNYENYLDIKGKKRK